MKVYLYGMKSRARDDKNYFSMGYLRDLYLEEMTCDLRDEYFNVLVYKCKLPTFIVKKFDYEFIAERDMEIDNVGVNF